MDKLELVVFIYYNNGDANEVIEYYDDSYSKENLSKMKHELDLIEQTVNEFSSLGVFRESPKEINGVILRRSEDDSADILDEFSIDLEQPKKE